MTFVPCDGCTLCCRRQLVLLVPEMGDDVSAYETRPAGDHFALAHKANGDCVYLGERGCTIHDRRPSICREYDCAGQFKSYSRAERRVGVREGWLDAAILKRGRELAEGRVAE